MADDARLWEPFTERGFTPDSGPHGCCPASSGRSAPRAADARAQALGPGGGGLGLAHASVPTGELDKEVESLVDTLAHGPTVALGFTKWLLRAGQSATLDEQLQHEALALELSSRSEDFREGLSAFRDKRPPTFEGR